ncbi:MAG TPA: magnesium/cobalt transporter CorA [Candidatus Krumholzibacteria bacterium]|nr:magnesium/cobalt transporter CorA [Candidatus Krumholzibacteria bacterium]
MFHKKHPELGAKPGSLVISPDAAPPRIRLIDYSTSHHETVDDLPVHEIGQHVQTPSVSWVEVRGLGDRHVFEELSRQLEIHPLAIEDAVNVPVRPKSELYPNFHLVVLRMIRGLPDGRLERSQVTLFVGERILLTVQEGQADVFDKVRRRTEIGPRMRASGPDYLAYALIDLVIDAYFPVIETISQRIEDLEEEITLEARRSHVAAVLDLRRELQELRRDMEPMRDLVAALLREESSFFGDDARTYLRDCQDHAMQLLEVVHSGLDATSQLLSLHGAMMSNRMNEIMKVLTVMSTIFIPLSFLTGLYGMNFVNMPELQAQNGYFVLLGVMAVIVVALVLFFRHKGWLHDD